MPKNLKILFMILVFFSLIFNYSYGEENKETQNDFLNTIESTEEEKIPYTRPIISSDRFIAHAGGRYLGFRLTNSKGAMENAYENGNRLMEIDFDFTANGDLVQVHDFGTFSKFIRPKLDFQNGYFCLKNVSLETFKKFVLIDGNNPMTIDDTIEFMENHKDLYIVTDVKNKDEDSLVEGEESNNIKALKIIMEKNPEIAKRFIPQIYNFKEYEKVKNLGYENIILTLYKMEMDKEKILEFAKNHDLYAITISKERLDRNFNNELSKYTRVYTHTINNFNIVDNLILEENIYGIYSDDILSEKFLS